MLVLDAVLPGAVKDAGMARMAGWA